MANRITRLIKGFLKEFQPVEGPGCKSKIRQLDEIMQLMLRCQFMPKAYFAYYFYESDNDYKYMLNYLPNYVMANYYRKHLK